MARELGGNDACRAVKLARELPLAGRVDPGRLRLPSPDRYRDSPELPARRITSDWDRRVRHRGPDPLALFGKARQAWDAGDEQWAAYQDALFERLKDEEVMLVKTLHTVNFEDEYGEARFQDRYSVYVVDMRRFRVGPARGHTDEDWGTILSEADVQYAFIPRNEPLRWRWRRWRRRRGP